MLLIAYNKQAITADWGTFKSKNTMEHKDNKNSISGFCKYDIDISEQKVEHLKIKMEEPDSKDFHLTSSLSNPVEANTEIAFDFDEHVMEIVEEADERTDGTMHETRDAPGIHVIYQCDECETIFMDSNAFQAHIDIGVCKQWATRKVTFENAKSIGNADEQELCENCGIMVSKRELHVHLSKHRKVNKTSQSPPFVCNLCGKYFETSSAHCIHMRKHTKAARVSRSKPGNKKNSKKMVHTCTFCGMQFGWKANLTRHERIHTGEHPYVCDVCEHSFVQKITYDAHVKCHYGERLLKCSYCGKPYGVRDELEAHLTKEHSEKLPSECVVCEHVFLTRKCLKAHKGQYHLNDTPYSCEWCPSEFVDARSRTRHISTKHPDKLENPGKSIVRKYDCPHCPKKFRAKGQRDTHVNTHTGEKPFQCSACTYRTCYRNILKNHYQNAHTRYKPFSCSIEGCESRFSTRTYLNRHLMQHNDDRPYTCTACDFRTFTAYNLKMHKLRRHVRAKADKEFKCQVCHSRFAEFSYLQTHVRRLHGEEIQVYKVSLNDDEYSHIEEVCTENEEVCIVNEEDCGENKEDCGEKKEVCSENEEVCIVNDEIDCENEGVLA